MEIGPASSHTPPHPPLFALNDPGMPAYSGVSVGYQELPHTSRVITAREGLTRASVPMGIVASPLAEKKNLWGRIKTVMEKEGPTTRQLKES